MTWTSFHSRAEVLRTVVETVDARRDGLLPMDVVGVAETFGDEHALLGALQLRWHTRLAGRVEREVATQPMDLDQAVVTAWRATADADPGVLAVLDHCTAHPLDEQMAQMLAVSAAKGRLVLAVAAGRSGLLASPAGVRAGAELEQRARAGHRPAPAPVAPQGLVARLRAALAA